MSRTRDIRRCFSISALFVAAGAIAPVPFMSSARAQDPAPTTVQTQTPTGERVHMVKKGDTLWDLAAFYYGNPFLWKTIYDANRPVVENAHWIFPVERLIIPARNANASVPLGQPVPVQAMIELSVAPAPRDTTPTILGTVDFRRPLVTAFEQMTAPWLSTNPQPALVARLARLADPTVGADKIPSQLYPNDKVLLGEVHGTFVRGDSVQIVRLGRSMGLLGRIVEPLGILRVDSVGATMIAATLVKSFGPSKIGDYVMAMGAAPRSPRGDYTPIAAGPEGQLVEFMISETLHGPGDLAFISLGSDQVRIGDELIVYTPEQKIDNERPDMLPKTTVGVVRVVKVTDHSATVRVTGVRNTGLRNGLQARLVRRAP